MVSTDQAAEFHTHFQAQRSDILAALARLGSTTSTSKSVSSVSSQPNSNNGNGNLISQLSSTTLASLSEIAQRTTQMRGELQSVLEGLPKYDQGKYQSQLVEIEQRISELRAKERPKSKFSFSSKKVAGASKSTAPAAIEFASHAQPRSAQASTAISSLQIGVPGPSVSVPNAEAGPSSTPASTVGLAGVISSAKSAATTHTISSQSRTYIRAPLFDPTSDSSARVSGTYTLSLSNLDNCIIDLRSTSEYDLVDPSRASTPVLTAIHAKNLRRCILLSPIVRGSAMLSDITQSVIVVGAQQFRIHSSQNSSILLHVASLPIIEHCNGLQFGSYPISLLGRSDTEYLSKHAQVQDFDWVRGGPSPHWSALPDTEAQALGKRVVTALGGVQGVARQSDAAIDVEQNLSNILTDTSIPDSLHEI